MNNPMQRAVSNLFDAGDGGSNFSIKNFKGSRGRLSTWDGGIEFSIVVVVVSSTERVTHDVHTITMQRMRTTLCMRQRQTHKAARSSRRRRHQVDDRMSRRTSLDQRI